MGRLLSLPGTIVLVIATLVAVVVIFAPARRRLSALEDAAERLGAGDLTARAPDGGGDEIARVSRAFNRMAEDLAARDEALRTSDRLRRQMLADVSHELKTPLTAMRGYVETLRMSEVALDDDRRARYLETIASETLRLDRIVKDLLDLARYENNVAPLEVRVFDVGRLFHNVARRHEHETQRRHITVSVEIEPAADQIVADPDRIEQVVENLVTNAVRHTPESGRIELRAAIADASAVLSVADSGDGIAPEHLPYVFDRFYKVDPARAAGGAGSGLGLSIARAIVVRHGGTIAVASAPGSTIFTISLPQTSSLDVDEFVADAPRGEDEFRILWIALDLAPQPADHRVNGSLGDVGIVAPDVLEQRRAAVNDSRSAHELIEQVELLAGQLDRRATYNRFAPLRVELHVRGRGALPCGGRALDITCMPPRDGADTREKLPDAERLRQVIVGAALEPEDLVGFRIPRRQHQDRRAGVRSASADRTA